jgi:uncharacterized low-complexity protein
MNTSRTNRNTAALLGVALAASLGLSQAASAQTGGALFSATDLPHGYMAMVGEGKCGEGKCGGDKKDDKKDSEGKCGEGKCGGDKEGDKKDGEGKCGEGKCGSA